MSIENGLILAGTGARGMPLVVEISVAFSVLIAFIVIGIFLFRFASASTPWMSRRWTASAESGNELLAFNPIGALLLTSAGAAAALALSGIAALSARLNILASFVVAALRATALPRPAAGRRPAARR